MLVEITLDSTLEAYIGKYFAYKIVFHPLTSLIRFQESWAPFFNVAVCLRLSKS